MSFLNTVLLLGGLGILIPILIHLLNRQSKKAVEWGAMDFLLDSLAVRSRRIQLEEALLMVSRCLLVASLVLALARPFVPPGASIPWMVVLPLVFLAIVCLGIGVVLHDRKFLRWLLIFISIGLLVLTYAVWRFENLFNLSRFNPAARQDIALVIDGSTSMMMVQNGVSNFDRAIDEARELIKRAPRGHAFSIILAGPSPSGKILEPTTDRLELDAMLETLKPLDGSMAAYHSFTLAALSLARGDNPAKQIVLFTDEQDVGWEIGKPGRWNFLKEAFNNLESEPQIMIRKMPLPDFIRNLAVVDVRLSREIVGIDREVGISVTVENTGNESVTPGGLTIKIDGGRTYKNESLGQIQPGEQQTVEIAHRFDQSGAHAIEASLEVADDIAQDNTGVAAINIAGSLKVLLVDGHGSGDYLERAASFPALALAPSSSTIITGPSEQVRFLVSPQVVSLSDLDEVNAYSHYDVIVLADVPRLPKSTRDQISDFVQKGGGLLVAAGQKADTEFYNDWQWGEGQPLMPAILDELKFSDDDQGFKPSLKTFTYPAFQKLVDPTTSDLGQAQFSFYRPQTIPEQLASQSSIGGRLNNGAVLLSSQSVGNGSVLLLGISLDKRSGNLVTRQSFVPLMHELIYQLAKPAAYDLNLSPGWEVSLGLVSKIDGKVGQGLKGQYFASLKAEDPVMTRLDSALQWNWGEGSPGEGIPVDQFKVRWSGKITVPDSGYYKFTADSDESLKLTIDGRTFNQYKSGAKRFLRIKMDSNTWYDFEAILEEEFGESKAILYWESNEMRRQIVPSSAFRTFSTPQAPGAQNEGAQYVVEGPGGDDRMAKLQVSESGSVFKLEGDIASGLYRLQIPEQHQEYYQSFLAGNNSSIPFTVLRNTKESHLNKLSEADYQFIRQHVTLSEPQTLEEVIGFLRGNQFGQELWKYLLFAALFFLVAELVLSRWIAKSRRLGEEIHIEFDRQQGPSEQFQEQLRKFGKA